MNRSAVLFEQVLGGAISAEGLMWLSQAFKQFDRCDGVISLERCLRLATHQQRARERRDYWLRDAASRMQLPRGSAALRCALAKDLNEFITRGPWARVAARSDPPIEFSPFPRALWHVAKAMEGQGRVAVLSEKQIGRILDTESA